MRKIDEVTRLDSTWNKIPDDEEVFIVRARDLLGPQVLMYYAFLLQVNGGPAEKVQRIAQLANQMSIQVEKKMPD